MSTLSPRAPRLAMAMAIVALVSPHSATGQLVSKPASVSLTVFIPPRSPADLGLATEGSVSVVRTSPDAVDLETSVGVINRPTTRVEVRLGSAWTGDSTRVWIQNARGELQLLAPHETIVALDAPPSSATPSSLRLRVEPIRPLSGSVLVIPLEYRLRVGTGDEFSVWTFPSVLRVDSISVTHPATR